MKFRVLYYSLWTILGLMVLFMAPFWVSDGWIDEVTGSGRSTVRILYLLPFSTVKRTTAVERWIVRHEGSYTHNWRYAAGSNRNMFGVKLLNACGWYTPSQRLGVIDDSFLDELPYDVMEEFVNLMRYGTRDQKEAAISDLIDWYYDYEFYSRYAPRKLNPERVRPRSARILGRRGSGSASAPAGKSAAGRIPDSQTDPKAPNGPRSPSGRDSRSTRPAPVRG
jgi:hypothetical protein